MKKRSFPIAVLVCFIALFSSNTFAQTAPGDWGDGGQVGEVPSQPSPVSFKRNNGNDICGAEAEIRVAFAILPNYFPAIEEIRSEARAVTGIVISNIDASQLVKKGYVSYCISSVNIIPAGKLWIKFHYTQTNQIFWLTESLNPTGK
ncbi:MAG: hypothetical protein JWN83_1035 [Chitinophagaceae bacterium]|nr:hypothetical protein [Chitinophagaceae bacterium]